MKVADSSILWRYRYTVKIIVIADYLRLLDVRIKLRSRERIDLKVATNHKEINTLLIVNLIRFLYRGVDSVESTITLTLR